MHKETSHHQQSSQTSTDKQEKPQSLAPFTRDFHKKLIQAQEYTALSEQAYRLMAEKIKEESNKKVLTQMADDEKEHLDYLSSLTGSITHLSAAKLNQVKLEMALFGVTYTARKLHHHKQFSTSVYKQLNEERPEAGDILRKSQEHEEYLLGLIDEERLHYVGAIVLGLNDALVEITGTLAGITFSLQNTKIVALTGIVTGIAATLSMAASNYLAVKADGTNDAVKAGVVTGASYLAAVILLVLPYLILPDQMYTEAFWIMIATVLIILLAFNYYLSVANDTPFLKRFLQMAIVSLGVAAISYGIGLAAKVLLGINIG